MDSPQKAASERVVVENNSLDYIAGLLVLGQSTRCVKIAHYAWNGGSFRSGWSVGESIMIL